jgi:hypothetical protein
MLVRRSLFLLTVFALASLCLFAQEGTKTVKRDPQAIEILTRTANAAGGLQALSAIRDLTESGEITFFWGKDPKGPVVIHSIGATRFRMDATLQEGNLTWLVKDGSGSTKKGEIGPSLLPSPAAINLENLTFPLAYVGTALRDGTTDVSFVGIENRKGASVYRIRVKENLRSGGRTELVTKDLFVDALSFEIAGLEDYPYPMRRSPKSPDGIPRDIEYGDFRTVRDVRVPFSVGTSVHGQQLILIQLNEISFNTNLSDEDFK